MRKHIAAGSSIMMIICYFLITGWKTSPQIIQSKAPIQSLAPVSTDSLYSAHVHKMYNQAHLADIGLSYPVFAKAVTGFYNLKEKGKLSERAILTIADFDQASTNKRLYIIDLDKKKVLMNTWVAHGQKSGNNTADFFSNVNSSYASSIGFYVTGEEYRGKHGRSLKLDGMDNGFNDQARSRAIVVHGADYVSEGTIKALGRLGRSQGCPAVSPAVANTVIDTIEDKTVLFINKSTETYRSKYLDQTLAANFMQSATEFAAD